MSQKDFVHDAVKNALIKDEWKITADSYTMEFEGERVYADLAADAPIEAERKGNKIVVEVKSFRGASLLYELHEAIGQYVNYRVILSLVAPERVMYLAFSQETFERLKLRSGLLILFRASNVRCIIVDIEAEEVIQWIDDWNMAM